MRGKCTVQTPNGAEHAWSVRSQYANDRNSYANVRSSYANECHTSTGYWHNIVKQMSNWCCVFHTNLRKQENQYHSYDTYTLYFNNCEYMSSVYTCMCLYEKRCSILLANWYHRWMYWFSKICFSIWNTLYSWEFLLMDHYPCYKDYIVSTHAISNWTNETGHLDTDVFNYNGI